MLNRIQLFINKYSLFAKTDTLLLAISGGVDSMVMFDLLQKTGYQINIAHCNFHLRGEESDKDEHFVKEIAEKNKINFFIESFNTIDYANKNYISIEMAARELRYSWFEKLRSENNFSCICVAHHLNDVTETFHINLLRGTGLHGLTGIKPRNGNIVRPLLCFTRQEISTYAENNNIFHIEDSSNNNDIYIRNKLRINIIPELIKINPNYTQTISETINRLSGAQSIINQAIESIKKKILIFENNYYKLDKQELIKYSPIEAYLYELLKDISINESIVNDIVRSLNSQPGKIFFTSTHRIVNDRKYLIINSLTKIEDFATSTDFTEFIIWNENKVIEISDHNCLLTINTSILNNDINFKLDKSNNIANLDLSKLTFPLKIRKWRSGDYFFPFGINKRKKISDFLTDIKLSIPEKENTWVIETYNNQICWVLGHRIDNRFKISPNTTQVFIIEQKHL